MPIDGTYEATILGPPLNIGAKLIYNGFTFNNRTAGLTEIARLTSLDGLSDADIRDTRESLPDVDGEMAYTALYGGRTIVLEGRLEALNLERMYKLKRDMALAMNPLTEQLLLFERYGDLLDAFGSNTLANYTFDSGVSTNVAVTGGVLDAVANLSTEDRLIQTATYYPFYDCRVAVKATAVTTITSYKAGVILKRVDANNYVEVYVDDNGTNSRLRLDVIIGGVRTNRSTTNLASRITTGVPFWVRGRIEGNVISLEHWTSVPAETGFPTTNSVQYTLAGGSEQNTLGSTIQGRQGMVWIPQDTAAALDDFTVNALDAHDVQIYCRKVQSLSGAETQQDFRVRRPFQIQVRASDPRFKSKWESLFFAVLTAGTANFSVNNKGNYFALPKIRIYGSVTNPVIVNTTLSQTFTITGNIPDNKYWDIDFEARTIIDSDGNTQFGTVSGTSDRITLTPGVNALTITPSAVGGSQVGAKTAQIRYRHSWIGG